MTDAIRFENLGHAYVPGAWIFRRYAAAIPKGSICAVLGPNGRGKTTLLKALLGLQRPTEGRVSLTGGRAFVPQLFSVTFSYSVLQMVLMGRAGKIGLFSQPSRADERMAMRALERFELAELAHRPFDALSGGQRQLVIVARALVAEADILVLDEPTSALDLKNQALMLAWMRRLSAEDGLTVLFTTHHPHHALAVADNVLLMQETERYVFGPAGDVLTETALERLYGVPIRRIAYRYAGREMETLIPVL